MEISRATSEDDNREQIWQLIIDLPDMDGFYHVDERPDRKPLRILRNDLTPSQLRLVKFGVPVELVSPSEIAKGVPFLEFTSIEISEDRAHVEFRYVVEGIKGTVTLEKIGLNWKVAAKSIVEQ